MRISKRYFVLLIVCLVGLSQMRIKTKINGQIVIEETLGDPLGNKEILAYNLTDNGDIIIDGNLDDWEAVPEYSSYNLKLKLAFNISHIMVAVEWRDYDFSNQMPYWEKWYDYNDTHASWYLYKGGDDLLAVGFEQNNTGDLGVWTASNRTEDDLMFEFNDDFTIDNGTLPYIKNIDEDTYRPIWDNDSNPIPFPETTIPDGTIYSAWFDSQQRPNESQNDMLIKVNRNETSNYEYSAEIIRKLNTGHSDDIVLNTSKPFNLLLGVEDETYHSDNLFPYYSYFNVSLTNEPALLSVFDLEDDDHDKAGIQVHNSLLIQGSIYDDFTDFDLVISTSKWIEKYGEGHFDHITSINDFNGDWIYVYEYNEENMKLGQNTLNISFLPQYEDPITITKTIFVEDLEPPRINGVADIGERYVEGVPPEIFHIDITVGIEDNFFQNDNLNATLYYKLHGNSYKSKSMTSFYPGSKVFNTTILVNHNPEKMLEYSYYVVVSDNVSNNVSSDVFTFKTQIGMPNNPGTTQVSAINIGQLLIGFISVLTIFAFLIKKQKKVW